MTYVENGDLQLTIDSVNAGETVVLNGDVSLSGKVSISKEIVLDLNGYAITADLDDSYGAIYIGTKGILTIIDNSENKTGSIANTLGNAIGNYGVVNIYGGTFVGNYALYNFFYNNTTYGTSSIYGGTFKGSNDLAIANCGNLSVNGGNIESIDTTNIFTMTNGAVKSLNIGIADYEPEIQSTSISGGKVSALTVAEDSVNKIAINGGTFECKVNDSYLTDGFKITYNENTGSYDVVVDNSLKVVATTSARIDGLPIKNAQMIFIQDTHEIAFDFKGERVVYTYGDAVVDEAVATSKEYTDTKVAEVIEEVAVTVTEF